MKLAYVIIMLALLMITLSAALESQKIYFIDMEYNKGSLRLLDVSTRTGFHTMLNDASLPYKLEILSPESKTLYTGYFEVPTVLFAVPPLNPGDQPGGILEMEQVNFSVSAPYYNNGKLIRITKAGKELLSIDASRFMIYCGDGVCQFDENYNKCPSDCVSGVDDGSCDAVLDDRCDPDCEAGDPDCENGFSKYWYVLPIILLIIIAIISIKRIKTERQYYSPPQQ